MSNTDCPACKPILRQIRSSFASCAASEGLRVLPVPATSRQPSVERTCKEVVAEVVVLIAHVPRPALILTVRPARRHRQFGHMEAAWHLGLDTRPKDASHRLIELVRVPPAVHVRLAEPYRPFSKDACVQPFVMDLYVPRVAPVDRDLDRRQKALRLISEFDVCHRSVTLLPLLSSSAKVYPTQIHYPIGGRNGIRRSHAPADVQARILAECRGR